MWQPFLTHCNTARSVDLNFLPGTAKFCLLCANNSTTALLRCCAASSLHVFKCRNHSQAGKITSSRQLAFCQVQK